MSDNTSPLALVTGASSGIGLHLGNELAGRGHDVVLCAEDPETHTAASEVSRAFGRETVAVQADL